MLVPLTQLLRKAEEGGYALMAPDFISRHMLALELGWLRATTPP